MPAEFSDSKLCKLAGSVYHVLGILSCSTYASRKLQGLKPSRESSKGSDELYNSSFPLSLPHKLVATRPEVPSSVIKISERVLSVYHTLPQTQAPYQETLRQEDYNLPIPKWPGVCYGTE